MSEKKQNQIPSLDLAFEWVKGVLYDQANIAENYNGRIATFFSIATLIIGIIVILLLYSSNDREGRLNRGGNFPAPAPC